MISYLGKFGNALKQYKAKKPIRFGCKVRCFNLEDGYLHDFEVYQGKGSRNEYSNEFGCDPGVVLGLLKSLPLGILGCILITILFSIPLLKHLNKLGIGCTETVRANILQDCHATSDNKFIKKQKKGGTMKVSRKWTFWCYSMPMEWKWPGYSSIKLVQIICFWVTQMQWTTLSLASHSFCIVSRLVVIIHGCYLGN